MTKKMKKINITLLTLTLIAAFAIYLSGCSKGNTDEMGIGPIKEEVKLAPIDKNLVVKGEANIFCKMLCMP